MKNLQSVDQSLNVVTNAQLLHYWTKQVFFLNKLLILFLENIVLILSIYPYLELNSDVTQIKKTDLQMELKSVDKFKSYCFIFWIYINYFWWKTTKKMKILILLVYITR